MRKAIAAAALITALAVGAAPVASADTTGGSAKNTTTSSVSSNSVGSKIKDIFDRLFHASPSTGHSARNK